mgnify:CR=1 FL=1
MDLTSKFRMIPIFKSQDIAGGAVVGDSINMKNAHKCTFLVNFGSITGNSILTVCSAATAAGTTSPLTFKYAPAGADTGAVSSDVKGTMSTSAALTLTAATYDNTVLIVEVDAAEMDLANDENWLTIFISAVANPLNVGIVALVEPRYSDSATFLS